MREYWLVDPEEDVVELWNESDTGLVLAAAFQQRRHAGVSSAGRPEHSPGGHLRLEARPETSFLGNLGGNFVSGGATILIEFGLIGRTSRTTIN